MFGLTVFLRDGEDVCRTYFTDRRGVEHLGSSFSYYDLTPYGRQEDWEVSPEAGRKARATPGGATTTGTTTSATRPGASTMSRLSLGDDGP